MKLFKIVSGVTLASLFVVSGALSGCASASDGAEPASANQSGWEVLDDTSQPLELCIPPRSDVFSTVTVANGPFGTWPSCPEYCPAGSYVYEAFTQHEANQGSGDDTALNGIWLVCRTADSGNFAKVIKSKIGSWGSKPLFGDGSNDLSRYQRCTPQQVNNVIIGAQMKIEGALSSGDDTAANQLTVRCLDRSTIAVKPQPTNWGSLTPEIQCPNGKAVCGLRTRVENSQGSGDDTALNGLQLVCCKFPYVVPG